MKKIVSFLLCVMQLTTILSFVASAKDAENNDFWNQASHMAMQYADDNYFSGVRVTIGESEILKDGESTVT